MATTFDLILTGGTVVNHDGEGRRDIGVKAGRIARIGDLAQASAGETIDCTGLHILPGVVDSQVHFREPGLEHKEDLETGSRAAVLGGVTAVFEMPNTNPLTTSEAALADKVRRATGRMHCDFAFWVGGTRDNARDVGELERLPGAAGIKVFMGSSTGDLLVEDDEGVASILRNTRRRSAFHSEDEFRLRERLGERIEGDPSSHPVWRDEVAALRCTERLVRIARQTRARIHVLHISTAEEIVFLEQHKDVATCEATPHHLTLTADDYARLGTLLQMNPPVRASRHRDGVWHGIAQGIVDVLGSDHAPHTLAEKAKPYPASPSGMTGVQTLVPIMLDHVNAGRLTLQRFVDLSSHGPQRIFGMARKGRVAAGYDADFTIVDMKRRETITNAQAGSKAGWTPYDGKQVTGWPVGTIVRGNRVMWEGEIATPNQGRAVEFSEALPV
ncbi:dihydroorotase [Mesorhizobium sp. M2D.F.Ca.ET.185.01.1.1]|uniref:dihydroorotase n=1 Tax=unclassified Mesorhizobium TaxID=325217 RepID=UPI000FCC310F|nr:MULTISPECIES: dihydroorotase [unclassified Mesorhizobium]TGP76420.1 dihydroorotase [bacterium M00.F.Ca.ET.227.01.1.1]TGP92472.1 dihydroorotase [bacterium M00.F.Ca.ET.222.01.1.1]TGP97027.1 dihydroorotase [bacterium M00.F.Ca.ET.221.01.1.1]TGU06514.1 dihydroorotase [bacterium M00.F.Ca.ET.163.01.1.1]TGU27861.1 dihydroorotase [bacterium M00.F.Ca.ET.156.01.1.1]TGU50237.1 dihydroorotase [bacterium M00.F.Ca.ET.146.01.1.1]TGV68200.1 dihydroorotase [Mesorhizobium sp. M2D.F.Ca.ET.160.01.1.1]TGV8042